MITINMSEYQEAHTVSSLKGAPPGYVGYGEGGKLTEAVRRKPYSVVLLDEVEKAHGDVHEVFFQVFDKGMMEDGTGRMIDFKNCLIILTSNVGTDLIMELTKDPELAPTPEKLAEALKEEQLKIFPAALLGRLVTIPYYPLSDDMMSKIVTLQLGPDRQADEVRTQRRVQLYRRRGGRDRAALQRPCLGWPHDRQHHYQHDAARDLAGSAEPLADRGRDFRGEHLGQRRRFRV